MDMTVTGIGDLEHRYGVTRRIREVGGNDHCPLPADTYSAGDLHSADIQSAGTTVHGQSGRLLSSAVKKAARELLGAQPALDSITRAETPFKAVSSSPHILPDGTIIAADRKRCAGFDGTSLAIRTSWAIEGNSDDRPNRFQPSFGKTGEIYFVTSEENGIRGLKDGREIMRLREPCGISSPVVLSDDRIAFGRTDGAVRVFGTDGLQRGEYQIPVSGDERDVPTAVNFARNGDIVVETYDQRVFRFGSAGEIWHTELQDGAYRNVPFSPLESKDGRKLFFEGREAVIAVDASTGEHLWSAPVNDHIVAPPIQDENGQIYVYCHGGDIHSIAPDGTAKWSKPSGLICSFFNSAVTRLAHDGSSHLCLTPDTGHFDVYSAEGSLRLRLKSSDIFRHAEYIHDFAITPDGRKAVILGGEGEIACIGLPSDDGLAPLGDEKALKGSDDQGSTGGIDMEEGFIIIDGVSLPRRTR
jgi:outer membrane protein assembly factor BamB